MTLTCDGIKPSLTDRIAGDTTVVELHGEIDLRAVSSARARLDALTSDPRPDLTIDLGAVTFIDCSGLGLLCRAHNRTMLRGGRFRLVTDDDRILRLLRLTGLGAAFEVVPAQPAVPAPPGPDTTP
ncbi:STAS domain-containing protein [Streptomyces glaucescens]|uniref:STAS domain-containing protein n=1 Tax=Streptomyces glaucescens TaxID=1907 RepID=UPI003450B686